jgi:hypothetical protein
MFKNQKFTGGTAIVTSMTISVYGGGDLNSRPSGNGLPTSNTTAFADLDSNLPRYQLCPDSATPIACSTVSRAATSPLMSWTSCKWDLNADNPREALKRTTRPDVPIAKFFDNLWAAGARQVGQSCFQSASNTFLVDPLNNKGRLQKLFGPEKGSVGVPLCA